MKDLSLFLFLMWNGYNFNGRSYIIVEAKMLAQSKIRRYGPPERVRKSDK